MHGTQEKAASGRGSPVVGEACPAAHLLVGPDGRVRSLNAALAEILGYERAEVVGRHVLEFVLPIDTAAVLEQLGRGPTMGWDPAMEVAVLAKDGTARTLLLSRSQRADESPGTSGGFAGPGVLLTGIDITDHKAAAELGRQRELRALRARHVESIAMLARGVAEHFDALVATVSACAQKLRRSAPKNAATARTVEKVLGSTTRAARITAALSQFAHGPELEMVPVKPQAMIDPAVEALRPAVGNAIEIVADVPTPLPHVHADAAVMSEALVELGRNALDAMASGGTLTLSARCEQIDASSRVLGGPDLPTGRYVRLTAADTGEGMDTTTLGRASEPFFTTRDPERWMGLGLAKVQSCVAAHNGAMSIRSTPGVGTEVSIHLPATAAPVA